MRVCVQVPAEFNVFSLLSLRVTPHGTLVILLKTVLRLSPRIDGEIDVLGLK